MKLKIILWGTGRIATDVLDNCLTLQAYDIYGIVDNDIKKQGHIFKGYKVYPPSILSSKIFDRVVILTDSFEEIEEQILRENPDISENMIVGKYFFYEESIKKRYKDTNDEEIIKILEYLKNNQLSYLNYEFKKKYYDKKIDVFYDEEERLYYVYHCGKKMYFSKTYDSEEKIQNYYRSILIEQDNQSPHKYLSDDFDVEFGDVVIDAGVAEGNFSLEIIDKASKIYLIESDDNWIEALKLTFRNYMYKVKIIKAFVTSYDEGQFAKLDTLINEDVNFIKMDIEGNEWDGLRGATNLITRSNNLKLSICSYHSDFDRTLIESFMDKMNVEHFPVKGYMWFPLKIRQNYISTSLNSCVIRGMKVENNYG